MLDRVLSFATACMTGSCKGLQVIESKLKNAEPIHRCAGTLRHINIGKDPSIIPANKP